MAQKAQKLKANFSNAPVDFAKFVESHRATLEYLHKFGTSMEKAEAETLFRLAAGGG
jgi:hypothetical protein